MSSQASNFDQNLIKWSNFIDSINSVIDQYKENTELLLKQIDEANSKLEALEYKIENASIGNYIRINDGDTNISIESDANNTYEQALNVYSNCSAPFTITSSAEVKGLYLDGKLFDTNLKIEYRQSLLMGHRFILSSNNAASTKGIVLKISCKDDSLDFKINVKAKKVVVANPTLSALKVLKTNLTKAISSVTASPELKTVKTLSDEIAKFNKLIKK